MLTGLIYLTFRFNLTALLTTNFGVRNVNCYLSGYRVAIVAKFSRKLHIAFIYDYLNLANFPRVVILLSSQGIAEPVWQRQVHEKMFASTPLPGLSVGEIACRMIIVEYFKGLQKS